MELIDISTKGKEQGVAYLAIDEKSPFPKIYVTTSDDKNVKYKVLYDLNKYTTYYIDGDGYPFVNKDRLISKVSKHLGELII